VEGFDGAALGVVAVGGITAACAIDDAGQVVGEARILIDAV